MNVLNCYPANMSDFEQYKLSTVPTEKMMAVVGNSIMMKEWLLYEEGDIEEELKRILVIVTEDGEVYGTVSDTFIKSFQNMIDFFDSKSKIVKAIKVIDGKSKSGRTFIDCIVEEVTPCEG